MLELRNGDPVEFMAMDGERAGPDGPDGARMAQLMERHLPALERFLAARAGELVLARESAADLAQSACGDVLAQLADGRFELRSEPEFRQWLFEAGLLKLKDRARSLRAAKRDPGREVRPIHPLASEDPGVEPGMSATPSRIVATAEARERLRAAVDRLPERDAEVLRRVVLNGEPREAVAESLGVDAHHFRTVLSRAMAKLAGRLGDES